MSQTPESTGVRRAPTMADVAQRAGVSATTASFVLAGREDMRISDAARLRVAVAMDRLSQTAPIILWDADGQVTSWSEAIPLGIA